MERRELDHWFASEILPLEAMLVRFLRRNWHDEAEVADLRQESYIRIYEAAAKERPSRAKPFLFKIARNLMIDKLRQKSIVSIETIADFDWSNVSDDEPTPEQHVQARQQLRLLQAALDNLPPQCRKVVLLRKIEGLSQREVAAEMGISEEDVEHDVAKGVRLLAQSILGSRGMLVASSKRFHAVHGLKNR